MSKLDGLGGWPTPFTQKPKSREEYLRQYMPERFQHLMNLSEKQVQEILDAQPITAKLAYQSTVCGMAKVGELLVLPDEYMYSEGQTVTFATQDTQVTMRCIAPCAFRVTHKKTPHSEAHWTMPT